jgi:glycosyltransferase involved in cell wall biosynthesis
MICQNLFFQMNDFIENKSVSVCMITYGHESYVSQAIESALEQIGDFTIELVVVNDCSPDNTDEVIKRIIQNHPKGSLVRYFNHENNIGMMPNFIFALQQCKGKYIALCEGDDYWIDNSKLQKQVDFLEANPEYVLSFHKVKILKPNGELVDDFITDVPHQYEAQETLARLGNYIHTPSVVFRNIIKTFPPEFVLSPIGDFFLYMLLTQHGKINYLPDEMAVYRFGVGIHSSYDQINIAKSNSKLFMLLLSCTNDKKIKQIFLERQINAFDHFEYLIRNQYAEAFVSKNVLFKAVKSLKHPHKFWKKLMKKIMKN